MNNLLLYKTFILRSLNTMLTDEGIVMTTAAAIDIEKILFKTDVEKLQNLSELKYLLSPLLCRNKEDQDKVYKVFDKLDARFAADYVKPVEPPVGITVEENKAKNNWRKIISPWYLKKVVAPIVLILVVLLPGYFFWPSPPPSHNDKKLHIVVNPAKFALVNDTVQFIAIVDSSVQQKNTSIDWRFPDTIFLNQSTVSWIVKDTAFMLVNAFLKDKNGFIVDSNNYYFQPVCEILPSVTIDETDDMTATGFKAGDSKKKRFTPTFANDTTDKKKYTYKWYVDDSLYSSNDSFTYSKLYNTVKLVVGCKGLHCSTDSMVAQVESVPALNAGIKGDGKLKIQSTFDWKKFLMSLLFIILIPSIISSLIYEIILAVKKYAPEKQPTKTGTEGPYTIKFNDQQHNINTDAGIRKLADILRKRQVSDIFKLNLRKTIRSTVVAGGIPKLEFVPLLKPMNFLVFIDKEKPGSFLVKLFEYLVEKLQKDEVNIVVYEYFKEPLFLSNEKLNQDKIPLEKIAALYPDTTLFIFGEAQYFLYPLKGIVKNWVTRKLNNWPVKILITPFGNVDWDKKEKLLIESNFVVLPADLSSLSVIDKIVSGQIDVPDQKKEHLESSYRSRFLNLQDFETLKNYLGEGPLLQWVCSLAIYPAVDWDLTIAIGKAIEQQLPQNGAQQILVNYTNLLKIARISWMQDGVINESLRVQMLSYLGKDAEALARETLSHELQLIENKIKDDSLVKANFDLHNKLNRFLLDAYHHRKINKEDESFIKTSLQKNQLDEGQDIYLDEGSNSLLSHPFKKEQEVGLRRYFKLKYDRQIMNAMSYALVAFIALILVSFNLVKNNSDYLNWSSVKPSQQTYELTINANNFNKELKLDLYYEPTQSKWWSQNIHLAGMHDTFVYNNIMITDTAKLGFLKISTKDGQLIAEDSFKLNSEVYQLNIHEVQKTPLKIYFKDGASLAVANAISANLPSSFSVSIQQQNFPDTAVASVLYFSGGHSEDGSLVAGTINNLLGIHIQAKQVDSLNFLQAQASIIVYLNTAPGCTNVPINALPKSLNEIWHGGTSNRLMNINLSKRVMYYSVNDTLTYGTYGIDEICLTKSGAYKIIAKTNQGYKLFFIRNVKPQSFELSVCQNFVQSKTELVNKDESYCDKFNVMSWYYSISDSRIYLPVSGNILAIAEKRKLDIKPNIYDYKTAADITLFRFAKYISQLTDAQVKQVLTVNGYADLIGELKTIGMSTANPFQRNYLVVKYVRSNNNNAKQPQTQNPPIEQNPNCSVTYTSLEEVNKLKNPLIVCKLDLSTAGLTTIPAELKTFTNMQELNLGTTIIPQSAIDQLKKELPGCKINYNTYVAPPPISKTMDLGFIYFEKGRISSESRTLLDRIGKVLVGNKDASIVLEAQYTSSSSQKDLISYVKQIEDYFTKMGLTEKSGQISENITGAQQQQIIIRKTTGKDQNQELIQIKGVNFPSGFNASGNKSKY